MAPARYRRMVQPGDVKWALRPPADHDGWLCLDGRTVRRADYPALFTAWGVPGDAVALPDMRGRVALGASDAAAVGSAGGERQVTIPAAALPAHTHGYDDATMEPATAKAGLLSGALPIVTGATARSMPRTTAASGSGLPLELPLPPHVALAAFVFGG